MGAEGLDGLRPVGLGGELDRRKFTSADAGPLGRRVLHPGGHAQQSEGDDQQCAADPATVRASQILQVVAAPTLAPGLYGVQRIAETAAGVAEDLATQTALPVAPRASAQPRAIRAAEVVRRNAEQARAAADRAKAKNAKNKNSGYKEYQDRGDRD